MSMSVAEKVREQSVSLEPPMEINGSARRAPISLFSTIESVFHIKYLDDAGTI